MQATRLLGHYTARHESAVKGLIFKFRNKVEHCWEELDCIEGLAGSLREGKRYAKLLIATEEPSWRKSLTIVERINNDY